MILAYDPKVVRQCHAMWGLRPALHERAKTSEDLYTNALQAASEQLALEDGDNIVVVAGTLLGQSGSTNNLRVMTKGDVLVRGTSMNNHRATGTVKVCKDFDDAVQKIKKGDIAAVYGFFPEFEQFLDTVGGVLLASNEYDQNLMAKAQQKHIPIIIDVAGVNRISDGMNVEVIGAKGAVLRK